MKLFLEPNDFLFFRDNKPFTSGETASASSLEMPLPSVLYGALRSHLLQQRGIDFKLYAQGKITDDIISVVGTPAKYGSLTIKGPYFAQIMQRGSNLKEVLYPLPRDLVYHDDEKGQKGYTILKPDQEQQAKSNMPAGLLPLLLPLRSEYKVASKDDSAETKLLKREDLERYLGGEGEVPGNEAFKKKSEVLKPEQRIGIAIGADYVTRDGMIYSLEGRRWCEGYGLAFEIGGLDEVQFHSDFNQILLHLGGERRFGRVLITETPLAPKAPDLRKVKNRFKLVLMTPAVFNGGWLPGWLNEQNGRVGIIPGSNVKVRLVAAAVGKPTVFSGFDIAKNLPKNIRRAVPIGSVYYFEVLEGDPTQVHNHAISDKAEDRQAGFGVAFVGSW